MPLVRLAASLAAVVLIAPAALGAGPEPAAALAAALPAVVRVDVVKRTQPGRDELMERLDQLLERQDRGGPDPRKESGSGFVLDAGLGLVAAAEFVVSDAEVITVQLPDGRTVTAELVAADAQTQLALLRAPITGQPAAEWADSRKLRPGDAVYAAGHHFDLGLLVTGGIHAGRIGPSDRTDGREYLATDSPVMPGSAGGPLLDSTGRVVGVIIGNFGSSMDRSLGIAVPADIARPILGRLRSGPVARGSLDVIPGGAADPADGAGIAGVEDLQRTTTVTLGGR